MPGHVSAVREGEKSTRIREKRMKGKDERKRWKAEKSSAGPEYRNNRECLSCRDCIRKRGKAFHQKAL